MQISKSLVVALFLAGAIVGLTVSPSQAAILDVDTTDPANPVLLGARNVDVNGTLYDVTFTDAICSMLFDGCDATSDFDFTDPTVAADAATELLTQVLIDGAAGDFDSNPSLTAGCELFQSSCEIIIPYRYVAPLGGMAEVYAQKAVNWPVFSGPDQITIGFVLSPTYNTFGQERETFARFTAVSAVPEPGSLLLLGFGLAGLGLLRRRQSLPARNSSTGLSM